MRESRRLLYVALTRKQNRLIVCGAWYASKKAKNGFAKNIWYEHCQNAMEEMKISSVAKPLIYIGQAKMMGFPATSKNQSTDCKNESNEDKIPC